MKAVNEGRIDASQSVIRHWDLCIQCRACEVVCPSGVPYGNLIESTMAQVAERRKMNPLARLAMHLSMRWLLPHRWRLTLLVGALRIYQRSGLQWLTRRSRILSLMPGNAVELESSLPPVRAAGFRTDGRKVPADGTTRARVALLSGCVMPLMQGPEMEAVVRVLTRNGCEVSVPKEQVCCGALNSHVGDLDTARSLARKNVDAFLDRGVDAVVVASAGCGSRMKGVRTPAQRRPRLLSRSGPVERHGQGRPRVPRGAALHPAKGAAGLPRHVPGLLPPRQPPASYPAAAGAAPVDRGN